MMLNDTFLWFKKSVGIIVVHGSILALTDVEAGGKGYLQTER